MVAPTGPAGASSALHALIAEQLVDDSLEGLGAALQRLCRGTCLALSSAGAAVQLMATSGTDGVAGYSDARAREWGDLAFTVGEGPCFEAHRCHRPVLVSDLGLVQPWRWPGYVDRATQAGLGGVFAFPLHVGAVGLGVLEVYDDIPRRWTPPQAQVGLSCADIATDLMLDRANAEDAEPDVEIGTAMDLRAEIAQAQGMVMVDHGIELPEALVRLRGHAFASGEPLLDLARRVVAGFVLPEESV